MTQPSLWTEDGQLDQSLLDQLSDHPNHGAMQDDAHKAIYKIALGFKIANMCLSMTMGFPSHNELFEPNNPHLLYGLLLFFFAILLHHTNIIYRATTDPQFFHQPASDTNVYGPVTE